jgi:hypothetical protein
MIMTRVCLENGLIVRVDRHCPITRKNVAKLYRSRVRQAMWAFRQIFSQSNLESCICAGKCSSKQIELEPMVVKQ